MTKHVKKVLTIITSASLTCGTAYAMQPSNPGINNNGIKNSKTKRVSKSVPKTQIDKNKKLLIGLGTAAAGTGTIATITTLAIRSNSAGKSSNASSSNTSSLPTNMSFSNSCSNTNSFQIQPAVTNDDPNKLDMSVEDKCIYKMNLINNINVSVYEGCITRVKMDENKGNSAVVSPDNEGLSPGYLAGAIANDAFGHCAYDDQQQLLKECAKKKENNKEEKLLTGDAILGNGKQGVYNIIHVVGPQKDKSAQATKKSLDLLKNAYKKVILLGIGGMKHGHNVRHKNINVCLISEGSFGYTTRNSVNCFVEALKKLKEISKSSNLEYDINLVIHPNKKYNTPSEGGNKTKSQIAVEALKNAFSSGNDGNVLVLEKN